MNMRKNVLVAALALGGVAFGGVAMSAEAPAAAPMAQMNASAMNWFGGESYLGAPALNVTSALVEAGGGASDFSFSKALVSMLGEKTVNAEVAKLTKQYGHENVTNFINGMTFAVNAGLKHATEAGVALPAAPADLKGVKLASTLVTAGTASDGTWWSGLLFDKALSHDIHVKVMQDIDAKYGHGADENTHKILNQAMYDVAQALKVKGVKLAALH
ncbi:MAG TPA: hypothetical protein VN624_17455 [Rhodanobacter sp.]|nr:hypothetical protein [Rhodanobacter sp.]